MSWNHFRNFGPQKTHYFLERTHQILTPSNVSAARCRLLVAGPDRLFHQSMPRCPERHRLDCEAVYQIHIYPIVSYLQWLELLNVSETLFELVCWKILLDILFYYFREITSVHFGLYEALPNTATVMLAPFRVWEVLWEIASSRPIKPKCCSKFQNGKIDNFTVDVILLQ